MRSTRRLATVASLLALGLACAELPGEPGPNPWRLAEEAAWAAFVDGRLEVTGVVRGLDGRPVAGATVELDGVLATTGPDGRFRFADRARRNGILRVSAPGFRDHVRGVHLVVPAAQDGVTLEPVLLVDERPGLVRMLFGGDMALGRRYLDPDDGTPRWELPPDDPTAVIRVSTAADDAIAVVDGLKPFFDAADHRVINLESPVLDDPATPHMTKLYAFFTLPASLSSLHHLGVQTVSLGNNHVYDYLEQGVVDTRRHLDAAGLTHCGAGSTLDEAWVPCRETVGGQPWTFVSATTIAGVERAYPLFTAGPDKGGAADARDTARLTSAVRDEVDAGRRVVALLHTGSEYARSVTDYALDRYETAADAGASLVIGHHTHTAQGFSRRGEALIVHSLGNFAFDQDRLETLPTYTVQVDLLEGRDAHVQVQPHVLEGYLARPAVGELADRVVRKAGEVSDPEGVRVVPLGGQALVLRPDDPVEEQRRTVRVSVEVGRDGLAHVDLRPHLGPGESLVGLQVEEGAVDRAWLGADLLLFGGFEDEDVDADLLENSRWYWGAASAPCVGTVFRGAGAFCLWRDADDRDPASVAFRNRVRVMGDAENLPHRDLTLMGWVKADNAGLIEVYARYYASFGEKGFGLESLVHDDGGTFDWRPLAVPVHVPPDLPEWVDPWADNPRALRVFLAHHPPDEGAGQVAFDDLAVVSWHLGPYAPEGPLDVPRPHVAEFVRLHGGEGPAVVALTLAREVVPAAR